MRGHGVLRVAHGGNAAARIVARLFLLPPAGDAVETRLLVTPAGNGERWQRTFGTRALNTRQYPAGDNGFAERIGPLEFRFEREPCDGGTIFRQVGAAIVLGPLRVRLPRWCAPAVTAREDRTGEHRVCIDVRVSLPIVGPILSYAGTIDVDEAPRTSAASEPAERIRLRATRFGGQGGETSERSERVHASGAGPGAPASERVGESEGRSPSDKK